MRRHSSVGQSAPLIRVRSMVRSHLSLPVRESMNGEQFEEHFDEMVEAFTEAITVAAVQCPEGFRQFIGHCRNEEELKERSQVYLGA